MLAPAAIQVKFVWNALPVPWPKTAVVTLVAHKTTASSLKFVFTDFRVLAGPPARYWCSGARCFYEMGSARIGMVKSGCVNGIIGELPVAVGVGDVGGNIHPSHRRRKACCGLNHMGGVRVGGRKMGRGNSRGCVGDGVWVTRRFGRSCWGR